MENNTFFQFFLNKLNYFIQEIKKSPSIYENFYELEMQEYHLLDDFFIFLKSLNINNEKLFEVLKQSNSSFSLSEILFGNEFSNDIHRKNKINQFIPLLEDNFSFFHECFSTCLKTHKNIHPTLQQKNQDYFLILIHLGMKKNYFQLFSEKDKETNFPNYKNILVEFNIFKQDYDNVKTISSIYPLRLSNQEILQHFIMFYESIFEFLINLNEEKWAVIIKDNFPNYNHDSPLSSLLINTICYFLFETPINKDINSCIKIFENDFIRKNLLIHNKSKYSYENGILSLFNIHNLLNKTFHLFSEQEKQSLFFFKPSQETSIFYSFYSKNNPFIKEKDYYLTIQTVLKYIELSKPTSNQSDQEFSTTVTTILFNNLSTYTSPKTIEKLCYQYKSFIINTSYFKMENENLVILLDKIHLLTHNNKNLDFIKENIQHQIINLFEGFLNTSQEKNSYFMTHTIKKITSFLKIYQDISFLNHFNHNYLNWGNFQIDYSKKLLNKKSIYTNQNIMFYVFEQLSAKNQEKFIDWVIQKENIEQFQNLNINNKNILAYYNKSNSRIYEMIIGCILEKPHAFFQLLFKNKKELKQALLIPNENIQIKLNYHIFQQQINQKTETKKSIKI